MSITSSSALSVHVGTGSEQDVEANIFADGEQSREIVGSGLEICGILGAAVIPPVAIE